MFHFQDADRKGDVTEHLTSREYHGIKTKDGITKEQAVSYWNSLFGDLADDSEDNNIDEDSLLTEIYGRCEDEFSVDFEIDTDVQTVLEKFNAESWVHLSDAEKRTVITDLVSVIGEKLGLENIPEISFYEGLDNDCGAYNTKENIISINGKNFSNPKEVVDTIAHEMRHAYQYQHALTPKSYLDTLYKCNFDNYISPVQLADGKFLFFIDYQDQLLEAEARTFADLFTDKEVSL